MNTVDRTVTKTAKTVNVTTTIKYNEQYETKYLIILDNLTPKYSMTYPLLLHHTTNAISSYIKLTTDDHKDRLEQKKPTVDENHFEVVPCIECRYILNYTNCVRL